MAEKENIPITILYKGRKVVCRMQSDKSKKSFDQALEMMNYFQQESMFRQQHYWSFLFKTFALSIIVSIMPIVSEIFGVKLNALALRIRPFFPAMGACIALVCFFVLLDEASKIRAVNEAKYRINRTLMHPQYHYNFYTNVGTDYPKNDTGKNSLKSITRYLAFKMPCLILIAEWIVSGIVYWILLSK